MNSSPIPYPKHRISVETFYLATGKVVLPDENLDDSSIQQYADAITAIEQGNFQPNPQARV